MTDFNDNFDDISDNEEFNLQIEDENTFDKYCDDFKDLHDTMLDYVSYSSNPNLMQFSNYLDLMNAVDKDQFEFTTHENKTYLKSKAHINRTIIDNCIFPDPIDFSNLNDDDDELKEKNLSILTYDITSTSTSKRKHKCRRRRKNNKKQLDEIITEKTNKSSKFTGWGKNTIRKINMTDILNETTKPIQNLNNPTKPIQNLNNPTKPIQNLNKPTKQYSSKYVPPSLR